MLTHIVYTKCCKLLFCIMFTCLNTDVFPIVFIFCLQKVRSLFKGDGVLSSIPLDGCVIVLYIHFRYHIFQNSIFMYYLHVSISFSVIKNLTYEFNIYNFDFTNEKNKL